MTKWQYGWVSYMRNKRGKSGAALLSPSAEMMPEFSTGDLTHLSTFLVRAGSLGWEMCGTLEPFPAGMELAEEADGQDNKTWWVKEPGEVQWLMFKRPMA